IGYLVVILEKTDECRGRNAPRRRPAGLLLPVIVLSLKEVAVLRRRYELLWLAVRVAVVRLGPAGERHHRGVMKVVIPQAVEAETTLAIRPDEFDVLRFVLGDDDRRAVSRGVPHPLVHDRQD